MFRKGIIYILIATAAFSLMNVLAKELSTFHPMQVVFFRASGTFVFIFPYMLLRKASIIGNNPGWLMIRAIAGAVSLGTFFWAMQRVPLGSAISIRYLGPIFGAIIAFYALKEKIKWLQWLSFGVAFLGVVLIKGFDVRVDSFSLLLLLISALLVGVVFVVIRFLSDKEHYLTIINYFMVIAILFSLIFIKYWRLPIGQEWWPALSIGVLGLIGQVFMTKAFQTEETSVLAPFKYMELVWALILGYIIFGETYHLLPMLGIVFILLGMLLNIYGKKMQS